LLSGCYRKEEENPLGFAGIFGQIAEEYFRRHVGAHRYGDSRDDARDS
jgi:acetyl-CoA C-acetyltransferase